MDNQCHLLLPNCKAVQTQHTVTDRAREKSIAQPNSPINVIKLLLAKLAIEYTAKVTRERTGIALSNIYIDGSIARGWKDYSQLKNKTKVRKMHLGESTSMSKREELGLKD